MFQGSGFRFRVSGFKVQGLGFRFEGSHSVKEPNDSKRHGQHRLRKVPLGLLGLGFQDSGFRTQGAEFRA
jgi:hypothetical protein